MRDRLIELLKKEIYPKEGVDGAEVVADYLLDNGVILPFCKIGDTIYQTDGIRIYKSTINEIFFISTKLIYRTENFDFDETAIGNSIFLTKEEAEQALAREMCWLPICPKQSMHTHKRKGW